MKWFRPGLPDREEKSNENKENFVRHDEHSDGGNSSCWLRQLWLEHFRFHRGSCTGQRSIHLCFQHS